MGRKMNKYTTKRGFDIELLNCGEMIAAFFKSHNESAPKPPTYTIQSMGGGFNEFVLDEKSAETDEEKAALEQYKIAAGAHDEKTTREFINLIFLRGIRVVENGDGWAQEQERLFGIRVPADPAERRLHYLTTEVLGGLSPDELKEETAHIVSGVMRVSGMDGEAVSQIEGIFLGTVGPNAGPGDTPGQAPKGRARRTLVLQPKVRGGRRRGGKDGKGN